MAHQVSKIAPFTQSVMNVKMHIRAASSQRLIVQGLKSSHSSSASHLKGVGYIVGSMLTLGCNEGTIDKDGGREGRLLGVGVGKTETDGSYVLMVGTCDGTIDTDGEDEELGCIEGAR